MKQKKSKIGAQTRAQIAATLPIALDKAITSYHDFVDNPEQDNMTDFKNQHMAAKAALAHIELLMKLASVVDAMDNELQGNLQILIDKARVELEGDNA